MKLKKGDHVQCDPGQGHRQDGRDRARLPRHASGSIVESPGVNVAKKHQKPTNATMQGGIRTRTMPIHVSNLMLVCAAGRAGRRSGYRIEPDGTKVRVCRKCGK